jgi:hypothetical protein
MSATTENADLSRLTREIAETKHELDDEAKRHMEARAEILRRQGELEAARAHALAGTDAETLEIARGMIEIRGQVENLTQQIVVDAVEDIAGGCMLLRREYFGRKFYASFDQREDHRYGQGPKHGTIVFGIGLTKNARTMIEKWDGIVGGKDGETTQAMIRYLLNLEEAGVA